MVQLEGEKMSKSKGNVVSPQRIVEEYGADTARLFMMQAAQPERDFDWSEEGVQSTYAFLDRLKGMVEQYVTNEPDGDDDAVASYVDAEIDATIAIASDEYDDLTFNKALRETQDLTRTLRQYANHTEPNAEIYERGLSAVVRLLARSHRTSRKSCTTNWAARDSSPRPNGRPPMSTATTSPSAVGWSRTLVRISATSSRSPGSRTRRRSTSLSPPTGSTMPSRSRSKATPTT